MASCFASHDRFVSLCGHFVCIVVVVRLLVIALCFVIFFTYFKVILHLRGRFASVILYFVFCGCLVPLWLLRCISYRLLCVSLVSFSLLLGSFCFFLWFCFYVVVLCFFVIASHLFLVALCFIVVFFFFFKNAFGVDLHVCVLNCFHFASVNGCFCISLYYFAHLYYFAPLCNFVSLSFHLYPKHMLLKLALVNGGLWPRGPVRLWAPSACTQQSN